MHSGSGLPDHQVDHDQDQQRHQLPAPVDQALRRRVARRQLATATASHEEFAAFHDWVAATHDPDSWVYAELVTLVERLADDQPAADRPTYQQWLYQEVRDTLAARRPVDSPALTRR